MNLTQTQKFTRFTEKTFQNLKFRTGALYMGMIIAALGAFEVFNFSSTNFALHNIFGSQTSGGVSWSTLLALAFCGMDFAGIARLLGPQEEQEGRSGWYLLGAWVLAAAMNAGLTWWGISVAMYNQPVEYALIISPLTFVTVVPVLVALMVWVIRILIIGTLVTSINRALTKDNRKDQTKNETYFGFKAKTAPVPAGFQAINNQARNQKQ